MCSLIRKIIKCVCVVLSQISQLIVKISDFFLFIEKFVDVWNNKSSVNGIGEGKTSLWENFALFARSLTYSSAESSQDINILIKLN